MFESTVVNMRTSWFNVESTVRCPRNLLMRSTEQKSKQPQIFDHFGKDMVCFQRSINTSINVIYKGLLLRTVSSCIVVTILKSIAQI